MVFTEDSNREWALHYTDNIILMTNRPLNFATNVLFSLWQYCLHIPRDLTNVITTPNACVQHHRIWWSCKQSWKLSITCNHDKYTKLYIKSTCSVYIHDTSTKQFSWDCVHIVYALMNCDESVGTALVQNYLPVLCQWSIFIAWGRNGDLNANGLKAVRLNWFHEISLMYLDGNQINSKKSIAAVECDFRRSISEHSYTKVYKLKLKTVSIVHCSVQLTPIN